MVLLALGEPERLASQARSAIEKGPAFLSVAVYWEVTIKAMKGLLDVGDPPQWFARTIDALALRPLLLRPSTLLPSTRCHGIIRILSIASSLGRQPPKH